MKGGLSGDPRGYSLTTEKEAVSREARHLGGSGGMLPPRRILDF